MDYMLLWICEMPGCVVWICMHGCCRENSGETWCFRPSEPVSPMRDLQEHARFVLELSLRQRALVLSGVTSRPRERGSPKRERVGALACRCTFGLGEEPHLWAMGGLAQASWSRLSEHSKNLSGPLSRSRLSESLQLEQGHSSRMSEDS